MRATMRTVSSRVRRAAEAVARPRGLTATGFWRTVSRDDQVMRKVSTSATSGKVSRRRVSELRRRVGRSWREARGEEGVGRWRRSVSAARVREREAGRGMERGREREAPAREREREVKPVSRVVTRAEPEA
jgi:hypothetical protein